MVIALDEKIYENKIKEVNIALKYKKSINKRFKTDKMSDRMNLYVTGFSLIGYIIQQFIRLMRLTILEQIVFLKKLTVNINKGVR